VWSSSTSTPSPGATGSLSVLTDAITVTGTVGDDVVTLSGAVGAARVQGLEHLVEIVHTEPVDTLTFDGNGGDDALDSTALGPDTIRLIDALGR
jgi:hypothetical protein